MYIQNVCNIQTKDCIFVITIYSFLPFPQKNAEKSFFRAQNTREVFQDSKPIAKIDNSAADLN